jgi:hypothetical protein
MWGSSLFDSGHRCTPSVILAIRTARIDIEPTLFSYQRQILHDSYAAVVEEDVVVWAQAQDVVGRVRSAMRCSEWPDVGGLRIGSGESLEALRGKLILLELLQQYRDVAHRRPSYEDHHRV